MRYVNETFYNDLRTRAKAWLDRVFFITIRLYWKRIHVEIFDRMGQCLQLLPMSFLRKVRLSLFYYEKDRSRPLDIEINYTCGLCGSISLIYGCDEKGGLSANTLHFMTKIASWNGDHISSTVRPLIESKYSLRCPFQKLLSTCFFPFSNLVFCHELTVQVSSVCISSRQKPRKCDIHTTNYSNHKCIGVRFLWWIILDIANRISDLLYQNFSAAATS